MDNIRIPAGHITVITALHEDHTRPGDDFTVESSDPAKLGVFVTKDTSGRPAIALDPHTDHLKRVAVKVTHEDDDAPAVTFHVTVVPAEASAGPPNRLSGFDFVNTHSAPKPHPHHPAPDGPVPASFPTRDRPPPVPPIPAAPLADELKREESSAPVVTDRNHHGQAHQRPKGKAAD